MILLWLSVLGVARCGTGTPDREFCSGYFPGLPFGFTERHEAYRIS